MRRVLFPPGADRRDWLLDGALAVGLVLLTAVPYLLTTPAGKFPGPFLAATLMAGSLVLRRHAPLLAMAVCALGALAELLVYATPMITLGVIPVIAYSVARWVPGRASRWSLVVGALGSAVGPWFWLTPLATHGATVRIVALYLVAALVCFGLVITPYAIGRRVREASEIAATRVAAAEQRFQMMAAEAEQRATLADSQTRAEIARELHDIVAHSLSVIVVQAEGARAVAAKRPEAALEALDTIADSGRDALAQMRRIVGVLRGAPGTGDADFAPAPTLADIPELVRRTSSRIRLVADDVPPKVSEGLALTVYRVVQEALTNVLKHAGPDATAEVRLTYGPDAIGVDIVDDGPGTPDHTDTTGNGLRGMAERVQSMGGRLRIESPVGGGFGVHARLPLT